MKKEEQELLARWYEGRILESVKGLFDNQDLINIAPDIVSACYAVERDNSYEDGTKVKILITCIDLMANLISISETYEDYRCEIKRTESK